LQRAILIFSQGTRAYCFYKPTDLPVPVAGMETDAYKIVAWEVDTICGLPDIYVICKKISSEAVRIAIEKYSAKILSVKGACLSKIYF
jgi:hypothetical protein